MAQILVPSGRVKPIPYNQVKRSVGVNLQVLDKTIAPIQWWHLQAPDGEPNWKHVANVRDRYDLDSVALMLRAHPYVNYNENIKKMFRMDGINNIVIRPEQWGAVDYRCDGSRGLIWEDYPESLFMEMYHYYAGQDKDIFITNLESDWQAHGAGCRARDECVDDPRYRSYLECCQDPMCELGTYLDYLNWIPCEVRACDMQKQDRAGYLLSVFNRRQAAAQGARMAYPRATVRVWHMVEVNFYGNQDWQFFTVLSDVIPRMESPPDFIGLSLYQMAGDPEEALQYAMGVTGLPAYRFIISETGARTDTYNRIYNTIDSLFQMGVRLAFVWDLEVDPVYDTGYSVVDRVTGEELEGMRAIRDLNNEWR